MAEKINIRAFSQKYPENLNSASSLELYYQLNDTSYVSIHNYGAVSFVNFTETERGPWMQRIREFVEISVPDVISDEFEILLSDGAYMDLSFASMTLGRFDHNINKMILLNMVQSVTLASYDSLSQSILSEIKTYTGIMRKQGKIKLNEKQTLKFLGRSLETKNNIAENLYILDLPEKAWEDEYLDELHRKLSGHFELQRRYRAVENTLKIIDDNLEVFVAHIQHKESSRLEWIIIILIVIEVLDTLVAKIM
jgi:uncharacterized Rmd1/YagE family protein